MGFPAESTDPTLPNWRPVPSMRSVPAATHSFQATIKMKPTVLGKRFHSVLSPEGTDST